MTHAPSARRSCSTPTAGTQRGPSARGRGPSRGQAVHSSPAARGPSPSPKRAPTRAADWCRRPAAGRPRGCRDPGRRDSSASPGQQSATACATRSGSGPARPGRDRRSRSRRPRSRHTRGAQRRPTSLSLVARAPRARRRLRCAANRNIHAQLAAVSYARVHVSATRGVGTDDVGSSAERKRTAYVRVDRRPQNRGLSHARTDPHENAIFDVVFSA